MSADHLPSLSDEELLARFANHHSTEHFDELVHRYYPRVRAAAFSVVGDAGHAADIAQEVFVRVFKCCGQFSGTNFRAWLLTITKRASLDTLAGISRHRTMSPDDLTAVPGQDWPTCAQDVEEVLRQLSRPQRICLRLLYERGLSYREIAEFTGYSEKAVKAHIQNGREKFKRIWRKSPFPGAAE